MSKLGLDAHERPPEILSSLFKYYRALSKESLENDPHIVDYRESSYAQSRHLFSSVRLISVDELHASFSALGNFPLEQSPQSRLEPIEVLELRSMPGRFVVFD